MDTIVTIDRIGPAVACTPAPVAPHGIAHAVLPASRPFGVRRWQPEALLIAAATLRPGGEVSPEGGLVRMVDGPIFDEYGHHKYTDASVPGRRGGT